MGLSKDLKRMSNAIKAKFSGGVSANGKNKKFNIFHFFIIMFASAFLVYFFYHAFLRKS